jgi:hypothetical protein
MSVIDRIWHGEFEPRLSSRRPFRNSIPSWLRGFFCGFAQGFSLNFFGPRDFRARRPRGVWVEIGRDWTSVGSDIYRSTARVDAILERTREGERRVYERAVAEAGLIDADAHMRGEVLANLQDLARIREIDSPSPARKRRRLERRKGPINGGNEIGAHRKPVRVARSRRAEPTVKNSRGQQEKSINQAHTDKLNLPYDGADEPTASHSPAAGKTTRAESKPS